MQAKYTCQQCTKSTAFSLRIDSVAFMVEFLSQDQLQSENEAKAKFAIRMPLSIANGWATIVEYPSKFTPAFSYFASTQVTELSRIQFQAMNFFMTLRGDGDLVHFFALC